MTNNIFYIENLADYISALNKIQGTNRSANTTLNLYFRGQDERYLIDDEENTDSIVASAFRKNDSISANKRNFREDKLSAYYRMIANQLKPLEAENFIAYAQHHGLHTQLIDVTEDPLVALYFTIEDDSKYDKEGIIYAFKQDNMINISEEMKGNINRFSIFQILFNRDSKNLIKLIEFFSSLESHSDMFSNFFIDLLVKIKLTYLDNQIVDISEKDELLGAIFEYIKDKDIGDDLIYTLLTHLSNDIEIKNFFYDYYSIILESESIEDSFIDYLFSSFNRDPSIYYPWYLLILQKFISINYWNFRYPGDSYFHMPLIPNFLYKPSIIFDRMLDQSGSFIVQSIFRSHVRDTLELIKPDFTIIVKNKKVLSEELDLLGIKRIRFFNDPDSIASYLNSNNW